MSDDHRPQMTQKERKIGGDLILVKWEGERGDLWG